MALGIILNMQDLNEPKGMSSKDMELALRSIVANLQLTYKYGDRIEPVAPTVHQLLCNIVRITPYLEDLITLAKQNGWYREMQSYLKPIEEAIEEVRKELKNGNEGRSAGE